MRDVAPAERCGFTAVNNAGDAVGSCALGDPAARTVHAALWAAEVMHDLNEAISDPSWVLLDCSAINDAGQITGTGTHDGQPRAFVLTPR